MAKLDRLGDDNASRELHKYLVINGEKIAFFKTIPTQSWYEAVEILAEEELDEEAMKKLDKSPLKDKLKFVGVLLKIIEVAVPEETTQMLADRLRGKAAPILEIEEAIDIGNMLVEDILGEKRKAEAKSGKAKPGAKTS